MSENIEIVEVVKKGRGRPKKLISTPEEEEEPKRTRKQRRTKEQIEEDKAKPKKPRGSKRTALWRYKENGKYYSSFKSQERRLEYNREYWRTKICIGWTCPYCNRTLKASDHKTRHWATDYCTNFRSNNLDSINENDTINENDNN